VGEDFTSRATENTPQGQEVEVHTDLLVLAYFYRNIAKKVIFISSNRVLIIEGQLALVRNTVLVHS